MGMKQTTTRRNFGKNTALLTGAATVAGSATGVFAAGSDRMKVALIGCGTRGTIDVIDFLLGTEGVDLVYIADLFQDRIDICIDKLNNPKYKQWDGRWNEAKDKIKVTPETCFVGFDAYEKVITAGVDVVLLCTPPQFRPGQLRIAVEHGVSAFVEKPAAVDVTGARSVIESAKMAEAKGLSIIVGTQQRRMPHYVEIMKRVMRGDIGEIVAGQAYWHWGNCDWHFEKRKPGWSDMEWQIRCWPYFTWLSGDHIVEQHVHNLDIMNWAMGGPPNKCMGRGGRQARTAPDYGNIYDHFSVDYEYPNGVRISSFSSQIKGATGQVGERLVGSKGTAYTTRAMGEITGQNAFVFNGKTHDGQQKQHADLVNSIRNGQPINEGVRFAESTLTAIMGRMSAYTGRALQWSWLVNASKEDLSIPKFEWGDLPVRPVAIPGKTQLV